MFTYLSNNLKKLRRWKIRILLNGKKQNKFFQVPNGVQVWLIVHFETSLFHLLCIILSVNVMKFAFWDTRVTLNRKKNPIRETTDWPTFSNHLWHETCVSKCCFFAVCLFIKRLIFYVSKSWKNRHQVSLLFFRRPELELFSRIAIIVIKLEHTFLGFPRFYLEKYFSLHFGPIQIAKSWRFELAVS